MRSNIILAFAVALSLLFTGCGGGGGGGGSSGPGGPNPSIVTLGGVDFDTNTSASSSYFRPTAPALTLYSYGPGIDDASRLKRDYTYSAVVVGGVPAIQVSYVTSTYLPGSTYGTVTTVFAKGADGACYIIKNTDTGDSSPEATWTAGTGGAVPSLYIKASPSSVGTYLGGYYQQYAPATPGGASTVSTPVLNGATPSGLFSGTIQVFVEPLNENDTREFLNGDGIVEIDESDDGSYGWKAVIPASG